MAESGRWRDLPPWVPREAYYTVRFVAVLLLGTVVLGSVAFLLQGHIVDAVDFAAAMGFVLLLVYLCMYHYWPWAMRSFRRRKIRKIAARRGPAAAEAEAARPASDLRPVDFMPPPPGIPPAEYGPMHQHFHILIEVIVGTLLVLLFSIIVVGILTAVQSSGANVASGLLLISIFAIGWVLLPFTSHHRRRRKRRAKDPDGSRSKTR